MTDFLLELLSEEIPARMQDKARDDLARLFAAELAKAGLKAEALETWATPRRLALVARGLPAETAAVREETKGPRASAPPQALEGFLRKTGLERGQLEERDGIFYAVVDRPGRSTAAVLAEAIPAIVRAFPWPKSMRWGDASTSTESLRWVRPLQGIVALFGEEIVDFEIAGLRSGAATVGHRFHHTGPITIGSANDYVEKLKACHVVVDQDERRRMIREGAAALAAQAGLSLVEDEGLVAENAGLTEWPVPLLGAFDPAYLQVPPEVIQLTMRTNQKYFALLSSSPQRGGGPAKPVEGLARPPEQPLHQPAAGPPPRTGEERGSLAPNFVCTANIEAEDGGRAIVQGNQRVLSARLSDAKFFWEQDLAVSLETQAEKLSQIVFHEKLGTLADKVDRVANLARWLVEEGIVKGHVAPAKAGAPAGENRRSPSPPGAPASAGATELAALAERAARLCKADLVTQMVGEFPELQGQIGGHLARAQGEDAQVADAIRDHYKPVGQGDEVPTAPVTVAASLADKLDTVSGFMAIGERPSGSRDPFAVRRAVIGVLALILEKGIRVAFSNLCLKVLLGFDEQYVQLLESLQEDARRIDQFVEGDLTGSPPTQVEELSEGLAGSVESHARLQAVLGRRLLIGDAAKMKALAEEIVQFGVDRLKVQQREAGVRHDLIDAVFALGGEDDLVRLLARVHALQAFVETPEGADLLAGYKRAANILKKEGWANPVVPAKAGTPGGEERPSLSPAGTPASAGATVKKQLSYTPLDEEQKLIAALDSAEPRARSAVEAEDFEGAMAALASLRAPVDAFFDKVTVNDPDPARRDARLALLARMRDAVHQVADFSRIEG